MQASTALQEAHSPCGAWPSSAGVASAGRMAACGHTKAQMLHCVQLSAFHVGTWAAMARFSMTVVPGGTKPSACGRGGREGRGGSG